MAAPGGTGPIGPFPASVADTEEGRDEYDRMRRRLLWKMPSGLYVLGSTDRAGRRNGMTINWVTQVTFEPKLVAVSVEQTAFTHELIAASEVFAVNFVSQDDRAIVRKFTKPVDVDLDAHTLNGFPFHDGVTGAHLADPLVLPEQPAAAEDEVDLLREPVRVRRRRQPPRLDADTVDADPPRAIDAGQLLPGRRHRPLLETPALDVVPVHRPHRGH